MVCAKLVVENTAGAVVAQGHIPVLGQGVVRQSPGFLGVQRLGALITLTRGSNGAYNGLPSRGEIAVQINAQGIGLPIVHIQGACQGSASPDMVLPVNWLLGGGENAALTQHHTVGIDHGHNVEAHILQPCHASAEPVFAESHQQVGVEILPGVHGALHQNLVFGLGVTQKQHRQNPALLTVAHNTNPGTFRVGVCQDAQIPQHIRVRVVVAKGNQLQAIVIEAVIRRADVLARHIANQPVVANLGHPPVPGKQLHGISLGNVAHPAGAVLPAEEGDVLLTLWAVQGGQFHRFQSRRVRGDRLRGRFRGRFCGRFRRWLRRSFCGRLAGDWQVLTAQAQQPQDQDQQKSQGNLHKRALFFFLFWSSVSMPPAASTAAATGIIHTQRTVSFSSSVAGSMDGSVGASVGG